MRSFAVLSAMVALAVAAPRPQEIDFEGVKAKTVLLPTYSLDLTAVSKVMTINTASAVSAAAAAITSAPPQGVDKRRSPGSAAVFDKVIKARVVSNSTSSTAAATTTTLPACTPLPTTPNTYNVDLSSPLAFQADPNIASLVNNIPTPAGYNNTFKGLNFSSEAYGYQGVSIISAYDPSICAAQCDAQVGCVAFNIFFEYDPVLDPAPNCPAPNATANVKCNFWGGPVFTSTATQAGQWREQFWVAIAGSNGYTSTKYKVVSGYTAPAYLGTKAINAPNDCNGQSTYMGYQLFTTGSFDPALCTAACDALSAYNLRHPPATGSPRQCRFAVTYVLYDNTVPQGQYCSMYTQSWNSSYATNTGTNVGADHYSIEYAFSYTNATDAGTPICPADVTYLQNNGLAFCSSYLGTHTTTVSQTSTLPTSTKIVTKVSTTSTTVLVSLTSTKYFTKTLSSSQAGSAVTKAPPMMKRGAVATPTSIKSWSPSRISAGCSLVVTAPVSTKTGTKTAPAVTITTTASVVTTKVLTSSKKTTVSVTTTKLI